MVGAPCHCSIPRPSPQLPNVPSSPLQVAYILAVNSNIVTQTGGAVRNAKELWVGRKACLRVLCPALPPSSMTRPQTPPTHPPTHACTAGMCVVDGVCAASVPPQFQDNACQDCITTLRASLISATAAGASFTGSPRLLRAAAAALCFSAMCWLEPGRLCWCLLMRSSLAAPSALPLTPFSARAQPATHPYLSLPASLRHLPLPDGHPRQPAHGCLPCHGPERLLHVRIDVYGFGFRVAVGWGQQCNAAALLGSLGLDSLPSAASSTPTPNPPPPPPHTLPHSFTVVGFMGTGRVSFNEALAAVFIEVWCPGRERP